MKRRTVLVGAGSLTAGSLGIIGSGAFASVDANRMIDVRVAEDSGEDSAYLRLQPLRSDFAKEDDGSLTLTFDGDFSATVARKENVDSEDTGEGLGTDSVYTFDDLFLVKNQGTRPISIFGVYEGGEVNGIAIYNSNDSDKRTLTEGSPSKVLAPGEAISAGVRVNTHDTPVREEQYEESLIIGADADSE